MQNKHSLHLKDKTGLATHQYEMHLFAPVLEGIIGDGCRLLILTSVYTTHPLYVQHPQTFCISIHKPCVYNYKWHRTIWFDAKAYRI